MLGGGGEEGAGGVGGVAGNVDEIILTFKKGELDRFPHLYVPQERPN